MPFDWAKLPLLEELERKALWLARRTVHNANHLRPLRDGLKVSGHRRPRRPSSA